MTQRESLQFMWLQQLCETATTVNLNPLKLLVIIATHGSNLEPKQKRNNLVPKLNPQQNKNKSLTESKYQTTTTSQNLH